MEVSARYRAPDKSSRSIFGRQGSQEATDSGTDAESKPSRKKPVVSDKHEQDNTFRKPILPASAMKQGHDSKMGFLQRQKSWSKEHRAPHGPRPQDDTGKRLVMHMIRNSSANVRSDRGHHRDPRVFSDGAAMMPPASASSETFLPSSSSMPSLDKKAASKPPRFSFAHRARERKLLDTKPSLEASQSFAFLPPVSFDDFQTSIAAYEPLPASDSASFPPTEHPAGFPPALLDGDDMNVFNTSGLGLESRPSRDDPKQRQPQRLPLKETLARREASRTLQNDPTMIRPAANEARGRRLSAFPSTSTPSSLPTIDIISPRKTLGPGALAAMIGEKRPEDRKPHLTTSVQQNDDRGSPLGKSRRNGPAEHQRPLNNSLSSAMAQTRSSMAKSTTGLARQSSLRQAAPPATPTTPVGASRRTRSSSRPAPGGQAADSTTPTSSAKRQSGRMSGLGARTISPTDARRMKRMSMMPTTQTQQKPTPSLDPLPDFRAQLPSPSMIPTRPSLTPSSARDTPDSVQQYHTSTSSLSRSSSYQSLRASSNSGLHRMVPSPSLSRLPTPRGRNVYSSAENQNEELVPPVPAIPKAYESPKDQIDTPFFTSAKSALNDTVPRKLQLGDAAAPATSLASRTRGASLSTPDVTYSGEGHALVRASVDEQRLKAPETPMPKKKSLQPVRLPPLSLQPLSTPTAVKIASLPRPSEELEDRQGTPLSARDTAKTPSTPMTASKATFANHQQRKSYSTLRTSASHHALRGGAVDHNALDRFANTVPFPMPNDNNKRQITPFTSGSLPRTSSEYLPQEHTAPEEVEIAQNVRSQGKLMGPRPRTMSKSNKNEAPQKATAPAEDKAATSGTSLRRKFSLNWKRSASKNANRAQTDAPQRDVADDLPAMPPPKYTTNGTNHKDLNSTPGQETPIGSTRSSLEIIKRRPSQGTLNSVATGESVQQSDSSGPAGKSALRTMQFQPTLGAGITPRSSSWSIASQNRTVSLGSKPPSTQVSHESSNKLPLLDKDDLSADDEMKRLSMKRKDVELAARLTDELQQRATAKARMTPAQAIQSTSGLLNIYEKGEIIDYKEGVYFCGTGTAKKHVGDIAASGTTNFGYDDERGDYNICIGDHLAYRYEVIDVLGKGSFGQVVRCIDHKQGALVAIKIIRNKKRFHQQALVEVNILNKLKEWDPEGVRATLTVTSSFYFRSHLCIVTPCLSINLYELIKEHAFQGFSLPLIRRFARQLLSCLQLLQSKRIIHCDLKPENILLCDPRRAEVRVIDFGSSCKTDEKVYTYIQSRFYRSPEVILGSEYGLGIDMWSFGCILAELYTGYPIFPGENEQEQLACIIEIFGSPSREIIDKCSRRKLFFDSASKPRVTVSSKGRRRRPSSKTLNTALKCDDEAFLDFLTQCLRWDPERRLRPDQATAHPFITNEPMQRPPADRPRPRAAVPNSRVSPTKRNAPMSAAPAVGPTPAKDTRARGLPRTPSTALRAGGVSLPRAVEGSTTGSPIKAGIPARRQSTIVRAAAGDAAASTYTNGASVAANKRLSNGFVFGSSVGSNSSLPTSGSGLPRMSSGRIVSGNESTATTSSGGGSAKLDLAGAAARESMGIGATRWR